MPVRSTSTGPRRPRYRRRNRSAEVLDEAVDAAQFGCCLLELFGCLFPVVSLLIVACLAIVRISGHPI